MPTEKLLQRAVKATPIWDVLSDVCKQGGDESDSAVTLVELSPKGESQSNVVSLRDRCKIPKRESERTKLGLGAKLKTPLRIGHPCMSWMVENVADTVSQFKIGHDGRTSYERLKGNTCGGSSLWERHSVPNSRKPQGGQMMERRVPGLWLGTSTTDELVIGLKNGKVVRRRNVRPKSLGHSWKVHDVDNIKGRPKCDLHV